MATRDIKAFQNARRAQRYPTRILAKIIFERRPLDVEIADISCVGACVRGHGLPERGSEVMLIAQELEVVATVVWRDDEACGVNFHKPIAPLAVVRGNRLVSNPDPFARGHEMRA